MHKICFFSYVIETKQCNDSFRKKNSSSDIKYEGDDYIETITADSESADKLQSNNLNQQIVCINSDGEYQHQIEVDEYNEDQLEAEEEGLDATHYERLTANVSTKGMKNENSSSVYYISSTPASNSSVNNETHLHTSPRQSKVIAQTQHHTTVHNDPDEKFLLSCLPVFKRLNTKKNALARMKIQQLLYEIEFEDYSEMSSQ